jgi:predicted ABC-type transport system involved in lysophospholipase L1 biosynthesis ATPase subunit
MSMLELRNIRRSYDNGRVLALNDVSLRLEAGEHAAVIGRSGSGKSTLINVIAGLDPPDDGTVLFDGRPIGGAREYAELRAHRIGIVFQSFCLIPTLTAAENVELPMMGQVAGSRNRRRRAFELLGSVGLRERAGHLPAELSGGERQRVAIARAMANSPALILADEVTGNLDQATGKTIIDVLLAMSQTTGAALLFVTHDREVSAICPRQIELVDGRIVSDQKLPKAPKLMPPHAVEVARRVS